LKEKQRKYFEKQFGVTPIDQAKTENNKVAVNPHSKPKNSRGN